MTSFRYKPPEDARSVAAFASDNFQFCVTSKTSVYLETIFGVLFEVMRKQFAAGDIMTQVFKVLRIQLNSIYKPFLKENMHLEHHIKICPLFVPLYSHKIIKK